MALKKRSHFIQICLVMLILSNGAFALLPSRTVAQVISTTTQQIETPLEFRQQKRGTESQFSKAYQQLKQFQNEQAQTRDTQRQVTIQAEIDRLHQQIINYFELSTLTNLHIIDASPEESAFQSTSSWSITVKFNAEGTKRFAELTKSIAGMDLVLGVFLNGKLIVAPSVSGAFKVEGITGGEASIAGDFTAAKAQDLAVQFRTQPALTTEPTRSLRLGYERLRTQDYQGAINYFTRAIQFDPKDVQTYLARAEIHTRLKNWSLARADYTQAIALSPKKPNLYLKRAKLYEELKQTRLAVADYEKVMQIDPKRFESVVAPPLLLHYLELKDKLRSIALVERIFPATVNDPLTLREFRPLTLCAIHSYFEDYNKIVRYCNQVLILNPENTLAIYLRGFAFEQTSKLQQARLDYQQVLKIDPQKIIPASIRTNPQDPYPMFQNLEKVMLARSYYVRGLAQYRLNNLREAIADFNRALNLDPEYASAYRDRGVVYKELGNLSAANQDFQSAAQRFKTQMNYPGLGSVLDLTLQKFPLKRSSSNRMKK
jgi:tetratricopeptide (TPR) repeat protein